MGYYFTTESKSVYTITEVTDNPEKLIISGGQFNNHEIYKPDGIIGEGSCFPIHLTGNSCNGALAGMETKTSIIASIHMVDKNRMPLNQKIDKSAYQRIQSNEYRPNAYTITTASDSVYTLKNTYDPKIQLISGGQFDNNEIEAVDNLVEYYPLHAIFTMNKVNGAIAGKVLDTNNIKRIDVVFDDKINTYEAHSGQFTVSGPSELNFSEILQHSVHDIDDEVSNKLGLNESPGQKIFVSNQQVVGDLSENKSQCVVTLKDMRKNSHSSRDDVIKTVIANVWSRLNGQCKVSDTRNITMDDMAIVQDSLSDKSLGLDQRAMIANSIQNIQRNKPEILNKQLSAISRQDGLSSPDM